MPNTQLNPNMPLTLMTTNVRDDLMDTDPSNQRWTDAILQREIDRTVDRYSFVAPLLQASQIATITQSRLYPTPTSAWWVERVEYPLGQWPKIWQTFRERFSPLILAPAAALVVTATGGAGAIPAGTYQWAATYTVPGGGETTPGPVTTVVVPANSAISISSIPTGPYGVTGRNIYRTKAGLAQLQLDQSIGDNTTASVVDALLDGALGANAPTVNTTQNIPWFELMLRPEFLPQDTSGTIEVLAAYKHELDGNGTTIPEQHWDLITLGAQAYAIYAYLVNTNDNFDYVDGEYRDRVDDTKSPVAWKAQADTLMKNFEARLSQIKAQQEATIQPIARWGDKPYRWDRL